ncbi:MAG: hypothetical protein KGH49_00885 [Candidatus Micrarchaeota archaeon]|nr:hypothetical protein [Candidatus Micrarchaeota archaeon]
MIGIVSSRADIASNNMAEHLIEEYGFRKSSLNGKECWKTVGIILCTIETPLIHAEAIDAFNFDVAYFLSKHKSANGVPSLTVHSLGNWGESATAGGRPHELSTAAPVEMLAMLNRINMMDAEGIERTYEATHHGPLLRTPSLFVELGGDDATINNRELSHRLADSVWSAIPEGKNMVFGKVAIGIGGGHYPRKFNSLALDKHYAFSHIMPKHAIVNMDGTDNLHMLEQAMERSKQKPDLAVIEWKSINANTKDRVITKLDELGLDYEKI